MFGPICCKSLPTVQAVCTAQPGVVLVGGGNPRTEFPENPLTQGTLDSVIHRYARRALRLAQKPTSAKTARRLAGFELCNTYCSMLYHTIIPTYST